MSIEDVKNDTSGFMGGYRSPISIIQNDIINNLAVALDGEICRAVASYDIQVDKEELLQALRYDRDQYKKGYNDGVIYAANKMAPKKLEVWNGQACCPVCDRLFGNMVDLKHYSCKRLIPNYCPNCGQRLDWSGE